MDLIPALSLSRPFAQLVMAGFKPVENRVWRTTQRGPFIVHAAQSWDPRALVMARELGVPDEVVDALTKDAAPTGFLGLSEIKDLHRDGDLLCKCDWGLPDQYHWQLGESISFDQPIAGRGSLQFFTPPNDVQALARELLGLSPVDLSHSPSSPRRRAVPEPIDLGPILF